MKSVVENSRVVDEYIAKGVELGRRVRPLNWGGMDG